MDQEIKIQPTEEEMGGVPAPDLRSLLLMVATGIAKESRRPSVKDKVIIPQITTGDVAAVVQQGYRAGLHVVSHATGRFADLAAKASAFSRRVGHIADERLGDTDE